MAAAALQQDWAYGTAMVALGTRCMRCCVIQRDETVAIAQFLVRRFAGFFSVALCTRGPVWLREFDVPTKQKIFRLIKRSAPLGWPRLTMFSPDAVDVQLAGVTRMHRVMTGHATVILDLEQNASQLRAAMQSKWRNRLVAAEASALRVERVGVKPAQYQWLMARELAQRDSRNYKALPLDFVPTWQAATEGREGPLLILRADLGRKPVAAMLFLRHGNAATYHIGWSDAQERLPGANNLLLWNAMMILKEAGVRSLDLGGVNTVRSAGVARFKLGCGGNVLMLAGTFL